MDRIFEKILSIFIFLLFIFNIAPSYALSTTSPFFCHTYLEDFSGKQPLKMRFVQKDDHSRITKTNKLEFEPYQFMQRGILDNALLPNPENYGLEFNFCIKKMGEAGDKTRPILMVSPRSADPHFKNSYALTYYLETLQTGQIVANLYYCKWSFINTSSPTPYAPLVEGYFLLEEDVIYNGRLSVENKLDGSVQLEFYVDGPGKSGSLSTPLLTYNDNTPYKITKGTTGPSFGTVGYDDDEWGINPRVQYDDIRLYTLDAFRFRTDFFRSLHQIAQKIKFPQGEKTPLAYLVRSGLVPVDNSGELNYDKPPVVKDLITSLERLNPKMKPELKRRFESQFFMPLTRQEASEILYFFEGQPQILTPYRTILSDVPLEKDALHFAYQNGYFTLDSENRFFPGKHLDRKEYFDFLTRIVNPKSRTILNPVKSADIFGTNAVLQREAPITLWGSGMTGDTVSVTFKGQERKSLVKSGKWTVTFPSEDAGGPYKIFIKDRGSQTIYTDVYVGEVFLVAGQSNAEMTLLETNKGPAYINQYTEKSNMHIFYNDYMTSVSPQPSANGFWYKDEQWVLEEAPAIGVYFVDTIRKLNPELKNMKIGIIRLTYGGSSIEVFLPPEAVSELDFVQRDDAPIMSGFWNGFMDYIPPFPIKAVLYYQGENSSQLKYSYEPLLRRYIKALRTVFENPELPILLVQICGYGENFYDNDLDSWPAIRAVQMRVANTIKNVGIVPTIDLADIDQFEIHPKDKAPIGERLAHIGMSIIYNKNNRHYSPSITSAILSDQGYVLTVDNAKNGLTYTPTQKDAFEIKTENGKWIHAEAKILSDKKSLLVWAPSVPTPQGVRYAWRNFPTSSVSNSDGLPLFPYNSTVNLLATQWNEFHTNDFRINIRNHALKTFDAIENVDCNHQFRMIERQNANILHHEFAIKGQKPGDTIRTFRYLLRYPAQKDTTESIVHLYNHGLNIGDWVRNNDRKWTPRLVLEVIDKDHLRVEPIPEQQPGDTIERFHYYRIFTAE